MFTKYGKGSANKLGKTISTPSNVRFPLHRLPESVLSQILANLSTESLLSLALVNKSLSAAVQGQLLNYVTILDIENEIDPDELIIQQHHCIFKDETLEKLDQWVQVGETKISDPRNFLNMVYLLMNNPSLRNKLKGLKIDIALKRSPWRRCRNDEWPLDDGSAACMNTNNGKSAKDNFWLIKISDILSAEELRFISTQRQAASENAQFKIHGNLTLFDCLKLLLTFTTNLKTLIIPQFPLPQVNILLGCIPNPLCLLELKVMIHEHDKNYYLKLSPFKNLKKFRLKFQENTEKQLFYLGENIVLEGIASQLESLLLKYDKTDFNHLTAPTWFKFFEGCENALKGNSNGKIEHTEKIFTSLKALKLKHCFMDTLQAEISDTISTLIPLENLEFLSLQIYEYSHKESRHSPSPLDVVKSDLEASFGKVYSSIDHAHSNFHNTFLMKLMPNLKKLKELWLKPTKNCLFCQHLSLFTFLMNFNGKIERLLLHTHSPTSESCKEIIDLLSTNKKKSANCTRSLKKLSYRDDILLPSLRTFLVRNHVSTNFDLFKDWEVEIQRQDIMPSFDGYLMESICKFNEREGGLAWSHWLIANSAFLDIISARQVKLFGENFKLHSNKRVVMWYCSNTTGWKELMYY
ncbi:hypothetical protein DAMA08_001110 [Martiniozyma asiatica (nom. inval.)]|nr:hypothetical protein DAMA08_001110 [Martiniozyma asiatica]